MTIRILTPDPQERPILSLGYGQHDLPAGRHRVKTPDGNLRDLEADETCRISVEPSGGLEVGYVCGRYVSGIMAHAPGQRLCNRPPHDGPCETPPPAVRITPLRLDGDELDPRTHRRGRCPVYEEAGSAVFHDCLCRRLPHGGR